MRRVGVGCWALMRRPPISRRLTATYLGVKNVYNAKRKGCVLTTVIERPVEEDEMKNLECVVNATVCSCVSSLPQIKL